MDYIEEDPQIEWVGTASELGAGYAVDGYARVKGGLGVLVSKSGFPFYSFAYECHNQVFFDSLLNPPPRSFVNSNLRSRRDLDLQPDLRDAIRKNPMPSPGRTPSDPSVQAREIVTSYTRGWGLGGFRWDE